MNRSAQKLTLRVHSGMGAIDRDAWDSCANPDVARSNPFLSHDFLLALEESGCATAETGWMPQHILAEDEAGRVVGAMPLYLKSHSQGEYVFDHGWANAFEQAGGDYYPKLQSSVPFTPVTGARFLVAPGEDPEVPMFVTDLNTPRRMERIADKLIAKGHSTPRVEKIIGQNFLRLMRETWT